MRFLRAEDRAGPQDQPGRERVFGSIVRARRVELRSSGEHRFEPCFVDQITAALVQVTPHRLPPFDVASYRGKEPGSEASTIASASAPRASPLATHQRLRAMAGSLRNSGVTTASASTSLATDLPPRAVDRGGLRWIEVDEGGRPSHRNTSILAIF